MFRLIACIAAGVFIAGGLAAAAPDTGAPEGAAEDSPVYSGYFSSQIQRLRAEQERYSALAASGGWPTIPKGPTIRPDTDDPRIAALAVRLAASGDLGDERRKSRLLRRRSAKCCAPIPGSTWAGSGRPRRPSDVARTQCVERTTPRSNSIEYRAHALVRGRRWSSIRIGQYRCLQSDGDTWRARDLDYKGHCR